MKLFFFFINSSFSVWHVASFHGVDINLKVSNVHPPVLFRPFLTYKNKINVFDSKQIQKDTECNLEKSVSKLHMINNHEENNDEDMEELMNMPNTILGMVKTAVGSGVLCLPAGVAAIGDVPRALIPAAVLMFLTASLSAYSCVLIGRVCEVKGEALTIGQAWELEVGKESSWIIALSTFLLTYFICIAFSVVMGDTFSSLVQSANVSGFLSSPQVSIMVLTVCALFPLCSLKSLASLTSFSVIGVIGLLLTAIVMFHRLVSCSYSPGGQFFSSLPLDLQPSFGLIGMKKFSSSYLLLNSIAITSYCIHFNAPTYYQSLKNNTMKRFSISTVTSFSLICLINITFMALGFLTFGGNCDGMVLNNYSQIDFLAMISRLFIGLSLIGTYPYIFKAMRNSFKDLIRLKARKKLSKRQKKKLTPFLLTSITSLALVVGDPGFLVSFTGAIMGTAISQVFPSIMYLKSTSRRIKEGVLTQTRNIFLERMFNKFSICLGIFLGLSAATVSVINTFFPHILPA